MRISLTAKPAAERRVSISITQWLVQRMQNRSVEASVTGQTATERTPDPESL